MAPRCLLPVYLSVLIALAAPDAPGDEPRPQRIVTPPTSAPLDRNIYRQYAIEQAAWVWAEGVGVDEELVLEFENTFSVGEDTEVTVHVTADQRYELFLDGRLLSVGPDRSDVAHWSFATYRLSLPAGEHKLTATVAWIGDDAPCAQTTHRGGFLFAAEGQLAEVLSTGAGRWRARRVEGWSFAPGPGPDFVGRQQTIDARRSRRDAEVPLAVILPPLGGNAYGLMRTGWRLHPSPLPDQQLEPRSLHQVRAVDNGKPAGPLIVTDEHRDAPDRDAWKAVAAGESEITVPADTAVRVLFDLGDYCTAYPRVTLAGGKDSSVRVAWAESLYETDANGAAIRNKGNRDEVNGKAFHGVADTFIASGREEELQTWWWRSGRYLLVTVQTAAEPLTIKRLDLLQTRYPLEDEGRFESSDDELNLSQGLMVRGMQVCAHETYMDCPYYEQLMYVGDTRVELLTTYAMTADTRLPKRAIELFEWSTDLWGIVAEHYPSRTPQLSPTFALIWVGMVRDFAYWRDDPAWVRQRLAATRGTIDHFLLRLEDDGLLGPLPGWPFVDWVNGWGNGNPPGAKEGKSSVVNLHLLLALQQAAEVEEAYGEAAIANRYRGWADRLAESIVEQFWVADRQLLADDRGHANFSEHAQCLALLSGILPEGREEECLGAMLQASDLKQCSIYFSYYLFEVLAQHGRGDEILSRWSLWKELRLNGLKTPIESPEPTRSDCHAWGSHPLFHARASLFGVRPAAPGFASVLVAPQPGTLDEMSVCLPHPKGEITGQLRFDHAAQACEGTISLPEGVPGEFRWGGRVVPLAAGEATTISIR
ncbi:Bacterial alpha-L-rhamnosidase [Posidoniimonas polymericola]|uniref:Bacterial alpha-L-rhamnosidase n=1 Tax=Posidoniimonas polymericola TaxID=2528002 RepID=A0A5C5YI92_9BACT|nr:family 78 glycoside hydrolase catalytic domain [Posidoniimonas polymericola]TWT74583.1 Bacterial alpha-L-rhamnosidase [Posidoniimonas polymericola]